MKRADVRAVGPALFEVRSPVDVVVVRARECEIVGQQVHGSRGFDRHERGARTFDGLLPEAPVQERTARMLVVRTGPLQPAMFRQPPPVSQSSRA